MSGAITLHATNMEDVQRVQRGALVLGWIHETSGGIVLAWRGNQSTTKPNQAEAIAWLTERLAA